jgi:hypothetical protein
MEKLKSNELEARSADDLPVRYLSSPIIDEREEARIIRLLLNSKLHLSASCVTEYLPIPWKSALGMLPHVQVVGFPVKR